MINWKGRCNIVGTISLFLDIAGATAPVAPVLNTPLVYNCIFLKNEKKHLTKPFTFCKWKHILKKNYILKMKAPSQIHFENENMFLNQGYTKVTVVSMVSCSTSGFLLRHHPIGPVIFLSFSIYSPFTMRPGDL